jgi:uncharacterized protein YbbC (DUF1343 family)
MLNGLDVLIFDMQDIGVRYYTYISTLTLTMEAGAGKGIPVIVLDRLNPLGRDIKGPILDIEFASFVGMHPIPVRHGMTIGELATMINEEGWLSGGVKANLKVIQYEGKPKKDDQIAAFTPPPSPNMPNRKTALNYAGLCLLEGTTLSEGRGTDMPFKVLGAPFIDSKKLLEAMLPFLHQNDVMDTVSFIPRSLLGKSAHPKYQDELCHGLKVTRLKNPINWTIHLFETLNSLYPDKFKFLESNFVDKLYGSNILRLTINKGENASQLIARWQEDKKNFRRMRITYDLYP